MTIPVVIVTNRSVAGSLTLDDQVGKRMTVVSKYVTEEYFRNQANGRFEVVAVRNVPDGMRQFAFGQVDAFIENIAVAVHYITHDSLPKLRVAGEFGLSTSIPDGYKLFLSA